MSRVVWWAVLVVGCAPKSAGQTIANPPVEPAPMPLPEVQTAEPSQGPTRDMGSRCDQDAARDCPDGMVDGCADGRTTHHACVSPTEVAGGPCSQEITKDCPVGQVDACVHVPALAEAHVCVVP